MDNIEQVKEFTYLCSQVNNTNDINIEIKIRIYLANRAYFRLMKNLTLYAISRSTKCIIYKTLIRPVLISETWVLRKNNALLLGAFESRILRCIYKGVLENGMWRRCYNNELYHLYKEPDIFRATKINRLSWWIIWRETTKQIP